MAFARILPIVLLLGLAGCSTTVFESLPVGTTTQCDPAWPGHWQAIPLKDTDGPGGTLDISPDCSTIIASDKGTPEPTHLSLVDTGHGQYLQLRDAGDKPRCVGKGKTHCGYMLLRYERDGDTIRLYDVDHAQVAAAIRSGTIQGYSKPLDIGQKDSTPIHSNFIAGDPQRITRLLRDHPEVFEQKPFGPLKHVAKPVAPAQGKED